MTFLYRLPLVVLVAVILLHADAQSVKPGYSGENADLYGEAKVECDPNAMYRTMDGSCNNLSKPYWGKSSTQFSRILPPNYDDKIKSFRKSVTGEELPLARVVSTQLTRTSSVLDPKLSVFFIQWGQFVAHDISLSSGRTEPNSCCNITFQESNSFCAPILIPKNDPFYSQFNHQCNNFVRNEKSSLGLGDQINDVTSFIDASHVYGSNQDRANTVRLFQNGLLKTSTISDKEWLPFDKQNASLTCDIDAPVPPHAEEQCVFAGDIRVNQQIGLTTLHLLFLREHNRIARKLKKINIRKWLLARFADPMLTDKSTLPDWDDEKIYQETRKIVGALIQHITMRQGVLESKQLVLTSTGLFNDYDPNMDPTIWNEFSTAAFRWHSLIQGQYRFEKANKIRRTIDMYKTFNDPSYLYKKGAVDELLKGMTAQHCEKFDSVNVDDIKHLLFPSKDKPFGDDLIATDIQRGRDHGMPTYNQMRKACHLQEVKNFEDLKEIFLPETAEEFKKVYRHVDDIDFFIGGASEIPLTEGIVGALFSCVVSEQFRKLRYGDRFWYENEKMAHSFTKGQLNEIRKITLAGIICSNGDHIYTVNPTTMMVKSDRNSNIPCYRVAKMNLNFWKK